ncbi:glycoside hydrolase superfamily [Aspergillus falconensis]
MSTFLAFLVSTAPAAAIWQAPVGATWQIVLSHPLSNLTRNVSIFDIDLFDNPKSTIDQLHAIDRKVICYFSAGTYEDWREDAHLFAAEDLGAPLADWPGERYVNVSSPRVREIMASRLDLAASKGCDAVDPDNVDGYGSNGGGLSLTVSDYINFLDWLAADSHSRGLGIGLKNAPALIPSVLVNVEFAVNEQCAEYEECDSFIPFLDAGKAVFHVEYPKGDGVNDDNDVSEEERVRACESYERVEEFSTIIKNVILDEWVQFC